MVIELVKRLDEAATELLACVNRGDASSEDLLAVLGATKAVRAKLDSVQASAAAAVAGRRRHGDGGVGVLAQSAGMSRRDARDRIGTAEAIDEMPSLRDAVDDGRVSFANAKQLAEASKHTDAEAVDADGDLLAKAESMQPDEFVREAKQWTARHRSDDGEDAYRRQRARRWLRSWTGDDGVVHLHGELDPVTGRRIVNRLSTEAHRLRAADKRSGANSAARTLDQCSADSRRASANASTARTLDQCMADALDNLTRGASGAAGAKPVADIALVARLDPDTDKLMVNTADGEPLPASVIDRLAGDSSLFGLVLSAKGVPIWKGRNIRRATEAQFQALIATYGGCAGCDETDLLRIQAHHKDPFALGGTTDLDNLIPLCWSCHHNVHDHGWTITRAPDGTNTIAPPQRTHHGPAHMPHNPSLRPPPQPPPEPARLVPPAPSADRPAVAANPNRAGPSRLRQARATLNRARAAQHQPQLHYGCTARQETPLRTLAETPARRRRARRKNRTPTTPLRTPGPTPARRRRARRKNRTPTTPLRTPGIVFWWQRRCRPAGGRERRSLAALRPAPSPHSVRDQ